MPTLKPTRRTLAWLAPMLAVGLAVGCGAPSEAPPAAVVRASIAADPQTLSLIGKNDRTSDTLARLITDSLVRYDARLTLQPRLARSWEVGPDLRTVTFHLRPEVRWQDGNPLTAHDVVWTVEKVREPAVEASERAAQFAGVRVRAIDDATVEAVYDRPTADFLDAWTLPILPRHAASLDPDLLSGAFARSPIGCGPFRFVRHEPGREVVLEASDTFWGGRPAIDRLVFRVVPDERTAYQALLAGELDLLTVTPDLWREASTNPAGREFGRLLFYRNSVWYLAWNLRQDGPLTSPTVRIALVQALDRDTFVRTVLDGLGRPGVTTFAPDTIWANPELRPWGFDLSGSRRALEAEGWVDEDGDGVRERAGRELRMRLLAPRGSQELTDRIAAWIQASFSEVGVAVEIEMVEFRTFLERRNEGRFDAAMGTMSFGPTPDQSVLYHSRSVPPDGLNFFGFSDPEVDRLLDEGVATLDPGRRREVYSALQRRLHELEPFTALLHLPSPTLVRGGLQGVEPSPLGIWGAVPGPEGWRWAP